MAQSGAIRRNLAQRPRAGGSAPERAKSTKQEGGRASFPGDGLPISPATRKTVSHLPNHVKLFRCYLAKQFPNKKVPAAEKKLQEDTKILGLTLSLSLSPAFAEATVGRLSFSRLRGARELANCVVVIARCGGAGFWRSQCMHKVLWLRLFSPQIQETPEEKQTPDKDAGRFRREPWRRTFRPPVILDDRRGEEA